MDANSTHSQANLEDRIFVLELALSSIGGALLAPYGWGDTGQLHQEIYATVRRVSAAATSWICSNVERLHSNRGNPVRLVPPPTSS
jgi:hypothetical protein